MALKDLSEDDRIDLRKRLAILELQEDAVLGDDLEVPSGRTIKLEMAGESPVTPVVLQTGDLDKVRSWIGTPERVAAQRRIQPYEAILRTNLAEIDRTGSAGDQAEDDSPDRGALLSGRIASDANIRTLAMRRTRSLRGEAADTRDLVSVTGISGEALLSRVVAARATTRPSAGDMELLRAAARTYIHGNKREAAAFKAAIEAHFVNFQVAVWLFPKVVVKKNSTLYFGTGVHNLTTSELIIESGGKIVSLGHLKVNVRRLRRTAGLNVTLPTHAFTGTLPRRPVFP